MIQRKKDDATYSYKAIDNVATMLPDHWFVAVDDVAVFIVSPLFVVGFSSSLTFVCCCCWSSSFSLRWVTSHMGRIVVVALLLVL
jgi:hypothetical protein